MNLRYRKAWSWEGWVNNKVLYMLFILTLYLKEKRREFYQVKIRSDPDPGCFSIFLTPDPVPGFLFRGSNPDLVLSQRTDLGLVFFSMVGSGSGFPRRSFQNPDPVFVNVGYVFFLESRIRVNTSRIRKHRCCMSPSCVAIAIPCPQGRIV